MYVCIRSVCVGAVADIVAFAQLHLVIACTVSSIMLALVRCAVRILVTYISLVARIIGIQQCMCICSATHTHTHQQELTAIPGTDRNLYCPLPTSVMTDDQHLDRELIVPGRALIVGYKILVGGCLTPFIFF